MGPEREPLVLMLIRARRPVIVAWLAAAAMAVLSASSVLADGGGSLTPH